MYANLCRKLWVAARSLKDDVQGIAALEYAVLAAIILVLIVVGIQTMDVGALFNSAANAIDSAKTAAG